jgi:hypothetical protein
MLRAAGSMMLSFHTLPVPGSSIGAPRPVQVAASGLSARRFASGWDGTDSSRCLAAQS